MRGCRIKLSVYSCIVVCFHDALNSYFCAAYLKAFFTQLNLVLTASQMYVVGYKWLLKSLERGSPVNEGQYWAGEVVEKPEHIDLNETTDLNMSG